MALVAAIFNLTLPNTPPPGKGKKASIIDAFGLRALTLLKDFNFALFSVISMLMMIPFTLYWTYNSEFLQDKGFELITFTMSLGQFGEIFFMLLVPLAIARKGIKWTLAVGLVATLVRFVAFLSGGLFDYTWLYFVAILVHGIIFGFFFVGGQVYVDKKAPKEIRAQAQGLIVLICYGIGMLVGNFFNGKLISHYMTETIVDGVTQKVYDWNTIWAITTVISIVLLVALCLVFRDDVTKTPTTDTYQ
jgi:MFS family permease